MNRFHVGGRILKTALAVTVSIYLAQRLGLERVSLAGLVALLTVQRTFYHSLKMSLGKLGSVLVGALLGTGIGYLLGNTPLAYGLATLVSILVCLQLRWQENVVLTCVTAISIVLSGSGNLGIYSLKQLLTALLGAACALVINYLFTPNHRREVTSRLLRAEEDLHRIIELITQEMLHPGGDDAAFKELVTRLREDIRQGASVAKLLREEQRFVITRETASDLFRQAFHMFNSQLDRLEEMHKLARRMPVEVPQAQPLVKLFRVVHRAQRHRLRGRETHHCLLEQVIDRLDAGFTVMELPKTRSEFVSRASLFHLFQEIKRYYRRALRIPAALEPRKQSKKTGQKKKAPAGATYPPPAG